MTILYNDKDHTSSKKTAIQTFLVKKQNAERVKEKVNVSLNIPRRCFLKVIIRNIGYAHIKYAIAKKAAPCNVIKNRNRKNMYINF